jgi:hypothetical protein
MELVSRLIIQFLRIISNLPILAVVDNFKLNTIAIDKDAGFPRNAGPNIPRNIGFF